MSRSNAERWAELERDLDEFNAQPRSPEFIEQITAKAAAAAAENDEFADAYERRFGFSFWSLSGNKMLRGALSRLKRDDARLEWQDLYQSRFRQYSEAGYSTARRPELSDEEWIAELKQAIATGVRLPYIGEDDELPPGTVQ